MSSSGPLGGAGAGGPSGSSGRKRDRPFLSKNRVKDPAATPPVSSKRGRLLGSHKKKTLAALAATAAVDSAGAAPAVAAVAPIEAVTTAATALTSIEAAATIIGTAVSVGAAPLASPLRRRWLS
jgi:hypothetical protein